jgi:hypothetical protein
METKVKRLSAIMAMVALVFAFVSAASAQTTTTVDVRSFEVIAVDGNKLVVRDQKGTQEYTVPDDFRFTVDGKQMSVSELKAGMKGTATVTTTTTVTPVVVTEVREAQVLRASDLSVTVREAGGDTRRFTQAELGDRGIRIVRDGQPVRIAELQRGDKLTATIITNGPPAVLTEQEVQATLAESKVEPAKVELAKVEPATTQVATAANVAQPAASAGSSQPSAAPPASRPDERSGMGLTWYVAIAVLIALALIVFMRRRKRP